MSKGKVFYVDFFGRVPLTIKDVWPDGDAPENPTVNDVIDLIHSLYKDNKLKFIKDWNLDEDLAVIIDDGKVSGEL